jgi:hypothetical protein
LRRYTKAALRMKEAEQRGESGADAGLPAGAYTRPLFS